MSIHVEGLEDQLKFIAKPEEKERIRNMLDTSDDPLMHQIAFALIRGKHKEVDELTKEALDGGYTANTILDDGLIAGMAIVGIKFRDAIIFVPEVLISARAMKAGMTHIDPILSASGVEPLATVVLGTVKGDLHDIGKNLCIMMLRGSGFVVHDLGVDTKSEVFIEAAVEHGAELVGMSALLTTTMPNMGKVIQAFEEAGMRDKVRIMVGGAPLTQEFADDMGADGYGKDAIGCVEIAKALVSGDQDQAQVQAPEPIPVKK